MERDYSDDPPPPPSIGELFNLNRWAIVMHVYNYCLGHSHIHAFTCFMERKVKKM